jgi:hypothetical protein
MAKLGHKSHPLAGVSDAEVLTVAVVSAMCFQNHHKTTLEMMTRLHYLTKPLSTSRFSRRLHTLSRWLEYALELMGQVFAQGEAFILDSMPVPVCKRKRSYRCRKVQGRLFCGYCAAKDEKFYGWRLHLVCTPEGVPVRFDMLPASYHDLTPVHELTVALPQGAYVYTDKAYNSASDEQSISAAVGVHLVPTRRANMLPNSFEERAGLKMYRHTIETVNSQLEKMGIQRLHARTNTGFAIKVLASLFALLSTNLI